MFKFLILTVLFLIFMGMLFGFSIFRFLFKGISGTSRQSRQNRQQSNPQSRNRKNQSRNQPEKKKIIDSGEGEYVDYEEIKD